MISCTTVKNNQKHTYKFFEATHLIFINFTFIMFSVMWRLEPRAVTFDYVSRLQYHASAKEAILHPRWHRDSPLQPCMHYDLLCVYRSLGKCTVWTRRLIYTHLQRCIWTQSERCIETQSEQEHLSDAVDPNIYIKTEKKKTHLSWDAQRLSAARLSNDQLQLPYVARYGLPFFIKQEMSEGWYTERQALTRSALSRGCSGSYLIFVWESRIQILCVTSELRMSSGCNKHRPWLKVREKYRKAKCGCTIL